MEKVIYIDTLQKQSKYIKYAINWNNGDTQASNNISLGSYFQPTLTHAKRCCPIG